MKTLTVNQRSVLRDDRTCLTSVYGVAEHGVSERRHVYAYLVRSAGLKPADNEGRTRVTLGDLPVCYRVA